MRHLPQDKRENYGKYPSQSGTYQQGIPRAIISVVMLLLVYVAWAISAKDILSKKIAPKPDV